MADVPLLKSPVPVSEISATGTADATTYLRGDGTWTAPAATAAAGSGAKVTPGTPGNAPTAEATYTAWSSEAFDDAAYWNAGSPDRLTIPVGLGGLFIAEACMEMAGPGVTTSWIYAYIRLNGATIISPLVRAHASSNQTIASHPSTPYRFTAGDYIEVRVNASNAGALSNRSFFALTRLGD